MVFQRTIDIPAAIAELTKNCEITHGQAKTKTYINEQSYEFLNRVVNMTNVIEGQGHYVNQVELCGPSCQGYPGNLFYGFRYAVLFARSSGEKTFGYTFNIKMYAGKGTEINLSNYGIRKVDPNGNYSLDRLNVMKFRTRCSAKKASRAHEVYWDTEEKFFENFPMTSKLVFDAAGNQELENQQCIKQRAKAKLSAELFADEINAALENASVVTRALYGDERMTWYNNESSSCISSDNTMYSWRIELINWMCPELTMRFIRTGSRMYRKDDWNEIRAWLKKNKPDVDPDTITGATPFTLPFNAYTGDENDRDAYNKLPFVNVMYNTVQECWTVDSNRMVSYVHDKLPYGVNWDTVVPLTKGGPFRTAEEAVEYAMRVYRWMYNIQMVRMECRRMLVIAGNRI